MALGVICIPDTSVKSSVNSLDAYHVNEQELYYCRYLHATIPTKFLEYSSLSAAALFVSQAAFHCVFSSV